MDFVCPYKCSYRTNSGYCGSTGGWERCQFRQIHQPNTVVGYVPPLKKTNADRIRAMTDEELANFLMAVSINGGVQIGTGIGTARWYILDWLKQEVDHEN